MIQARLQVSWISLLEAMLLFSLFCGGVELLVDLASLACLSDSLLDAFHPLGVSRSHIFVFMFRIL